MAHKLTNLLTPVPSDINIAQAATPILIDKIAAAATAQHLRAKANDVAQLTALAQRLLDSQPRERWCGLKSLDDIQ